MPYVGVNRRILAGLTCLPVSHAANASALARRVQEDLERRMLAERRLVDEINEDNPSALAFGIDTPRLAARSITAAGCTLCACQEYISRCNGLTACSVYWTWFRRRSEWPASFRCSPGCTLFSAHRRSRGGASAARPHAASTPQGRSRASTLQRCPRCGRQFPVPRAHPQVHLFWR